MIIKSNNIELCVERFGDHRAPVILLIAGLGQQLSEWPTKLCDHLCAAGYQVIQFDNRDVGLSQKISEQKADSADTYKLADMAMDTIGVLDALDMPSAHVVGMSMGGMIAQIIAANASHRVSSLCSVMSSSGRTGLPGPTPEAQTMLTKKTDGTRESFIENWVESRQLLGSPAYPVDKAELYAQAQANCERSFYPVGFLRQLNAINTSGGRADLLPKITCPTLVIHGSDDQLIPHQCGADTAALIPQADFELIKGMGHDLPNELLPHLANLILDNIGKCT